MDRPPLLRASVLGYLGEERVKMLEEASFVWEPWTCAFLHAVSSAVVTLDEARRLDGVSLRRLIAERT